MLKFFEADQCTKRHNKNSDTECLVVFDKNWHTLLGSPRFDKRWVLSFFVFLFNLGWVVLCCVPWPKFDNNWVLRLFIFSRLGNPVVCVPWSKFHPDWVVLCCIPWPRFANCWVLILFFCLFISSRLGSTVVCVPWPIFDNGLVLSLFVDFLQAGQSCVVSPDPEFLMAGSSVWLFVSFLQDGQIC